MRICLVRHAIAAEPGLPGFSDDFSRPLTAKGRTRMEEGARGLRRILAPDVILTSPLTRARETAEILAGAYGITDVEESVLLAARDYASLIELVRGFDVETVMTVGHAPFTSELLSLLLTGEAKRLDVVVKKGAAALVSFDGQAAIGSGTLEWVIQPAGLRAIARAKQARQ